METTKAKLRKVLVEALDLDREPDTLPDAGLVNELGLDSVNTIEFLIWVESEFGVEIADEDLSIDLIDDLNKLAEYVEVRTRSGVAQ
jgi:acyl carrier protein